MATEVKPALYLALQQTSLINLAWQSWQDNPLPLDSEAEQNRLLPVLPCWLLQAVADPADQALQNQLTAFRNAAEVSIHRTFLNLLRQRENLEIATHMQDRYAELLFQWFNGNLALHFATADNLQQTLSTLDPDWLACLMPQPEPGGLQLRLDTFALWQRLDTTLLLTGLQALAAHLQPARHNDPPKEPWQGYVYKAAVNGFEQVLRGEGLSRKVYESLTKLSVPFFIVKDKRLRLSMQTLPAPLRTPGPRPTPEQQALKESALWQLVAEARQLFVRRKSRDTYEDFTVLFKSIISVGEHGSGLGRLMCQALARRQEAPEVVPADLTPAAAQGKLKEKRNQLLQQLGIEIQGLTPEKAFELMLAEILARYLLSLGLQSITLSQAKRVIFDLFGLHAPREVIPIGRAYATESDETENPHQKEEQSDDTDTNTAAFDAEQALDPAHPDDTEQRYGLLPSGSAPLKHWEAGLKQRFGQKIAALPADNQIRLYYEGRYLKGLNDSTLEKKEHGITNANKTQKSLALSFFFFYSCWQRPLLLKSQAEDLVRAQIRQLHSAHGISFSADTAPELMQTDASEQSVAASIKRLLQDAREYANELKNDIILKDNTTIAHFVEVDVQSKDLLKLQIEADPTAPPFGYIKAMSAIWRLRQNIKTFKYERAQALLLMQLLEGNNEQRI